MVILQNAAAFDAALAAKRPQRIRVVFAEGTADEVEFGNSEISAVSGVHFRESVNSETNLSVGLCPAASVDFTIINTGAVDLENFEFGEAHIYLGIQLLDDSWCDVSMGYFIVQRPDVVRKKLIDVSAMDRMTLFDVDWPAGIAITTSTTMRSLVTAMCNYVGVPLSSAEFLNESITARQVPKDLSNKTMREVLAWVAEAAGSIARFNRDGQLEFFWYDLTSDPVTTLNESGYIEFSPSWFETPSISKLVIRNADSTEQYTSGSGDTTYIIQDNPFLRQSGSENTVNIQTNSTRRKSKLLAAEPTTPEGKLYDRLANKSPTYHPYGVSTFLDWRYQAGDMVKITSGANEYVEPIYNYDLTWNGAALSDLSATGEKERPPLSPLRRKEYTFSGGISGAQKVADEALEEVIYRTDFTKTDMGIGLLAQAIGVAIETNEESPNYGKPKVVDGKYQFDANGATLTGQINLAAGRVETVATQAQADATTALGRIDVQAGRIDLVVSTTEQGSVIKSASIVAAINNNTQQSEVSINANRVKIDGTAGVYLNGVLFRSNNENTLDVNIAKTGKLQVGTSTYTGDTDIYGSVDFYGTNSQITFQNGFRLGNSSPYKTIDSTFNPVVEFDTPTEDGGKITIPYKRLSDTAWQTNVNFNIAATQKYITDVAAARNQGKASVMLNDPTWNAISGEITSSRTISVTTSGRTDASGTTANLTKSAALYLTSSGLTVTMRNGSTSGTAVAKATCSDNNLVASNIKNGVTIFGVEGTYSGGGTEPVSHCDVNINSINYHNNSGVITPNLKIDVIGTSGTILVSYNQDVDIPGYRTQGGGGSHSVNIVYTSVKTFSEWLAFIAEKGDSNCVTATGTSGTYKVYTVSCGGSTKYIGVTA